MEVGFLPLHVLEFLITFSKFVRTKTPFTFGVAALVVGLPVEKLAKLTKRVTCVHFYKLRG